jgi:tripeptide aminopeptidase
MVNRDRIINEFIQLTKIDSISLYEREMADALKLKMLKEGINVKEDDAGKKIGGNAGNLICTLKGNKNVSPIVLMAHMDTVTPGIGKKPKLEGSFIKSDGTTVLGGDDVGGIVCILEAVRVLKEQNIDHGDIYIVFTVAEEIGLQGAKNLDFAAINAKYGFVMDLGGEIGFVATSAPTQNTFDIKIKGKAVHAGIEPEK